MDSSADVSPSTISATVDTLGLYCTTLIIKTAERVKDLKIGQVLKVISDDEGIKEDMPA